MNQHTLNSHIMSIILFSVTKREKNITTHNFFIWLRKIGWAVFECIFRSFLSFSSSEYFVFGARAEGI